MSGELWTSNGSPFCVEGDIAVNSLKITPNVRVEFTGNFSLTVVGRLTAIGSETMPIVFTTTADNSVGWQGIVFQNSLNGSELAFFVLENSINTGIRILSSLPLIRDCEIRNNVASGSGSTGPARGGGIFTDSPLRLDRCWIHDNLATSSAGPGGTARSEGGGIYASSRLTVYDSEVSNNEVRAAGAISTDRARGAGIFVDQTSLALLRSIIDSNTALARDDGAFSGDARAIGAGLFVSGSATVTYSFITRNTTTSLDSNPPFTGGIFVGCDSHVGIIHSTVADNSVEGARLDDSAGCEGSLNVANSIFWNNGAAGDPDIVGPASVVCSIVMGGFENPPGSTHQCFNKDVTPVFVGSDASGPDYDVHIDPIVSPAIDMGTDLFLGRKLPANDIDGEARGRGDGFDMGADEIPVPEPTNALLRLVAIAAVVIVAQRRR